MTNEHSGSDEVIGAVRWDLSNSTLYNETMGARYWSALALGYAPYAEIGANLRVFFANALYRSLYILAFFVGGATIWASLQLAENSIWQQLQAGISIGVFTFLLTPLIVTASQAIGVGAHIVVFFLFAIALFFAITTTGATQAYAVNISSSLILCLALDLSFRRLEAVVLTILDKTRERRAALELDLEQLEDDATPQYFAVGGGTIDETP